MSASDSMLHDDSLPESLPEESIIYDDLPRDHNDAEVTTDTWKGLLDLERDCTGVGPGQQCWLVAQLRAWNKVMHEYAFEIVESEPGKLHLQSIRNADDGIERPHGAVERSSTGKHDIAIPSHLRRVVAHEWNFSALQSSHYKQDFKEAGIFRLQSFKQRKRVTLWRASLAKQLVCSECYDRVQLPWVAADMPGLLAALISPSVFPEELCLPDVQHLPEKYLRLLFDAVAWNKHVHTLRARFDGNLGEKGTLLCEMLKANRSIKRLDIDIENDNGSLVHNVLHALAGNKSIIEVMISIRIIREYKTAEDICYFLAHNKTATKFFLSSQTCFYYEFVKEFAKGLWQNKQIVEFNITRNLLCDESSFTVWEALRRNKGFLNCAVEFVVLPRADRQHAEAFELFLGKPCLLSHLIKVTGKTEAEALLALTSAEHFLQDNYLIITGVIRNSVKCHPGNGTQVEKLNGDCWRAIVRHLNLTDVLLP
ncbi:uncharacterized protein LOC144136776 isoform X1 [Amblyomma americanum]